MDGKVVNHKYRTLAGEKKFAQDKDAVKCFWNFDALKLESGPVVITEGECDGLAAIQAGHARTISVPDGAPAHPLGGAAGEKYSYLDTAMPFLREASEIILAVDGDSAGANLFQDLLVRLGRPRCKFVTYPHRRNGDGRCKDLNEALKEYGVEGVSQTLARAQWAQPEKDRVYRMSELAPLPEHPIMELGFGYPLDDHVKARRGDFWVFSGMPGHGKTVFTTDMLCRLSESNNLRIAWASFENLPQQDLRRQLRKWHIAGQRIKQSAHPVDMRADWTRAEVQLADEWIDERFRFFVPKEDEDVTMEWFLDCALTAVTRHDCDVVIVDPYNEMDHERGTMPLTEYVGGAIKSMKRLARKLQILWIVVAHPAKPKAGEAITLYSISDSAHWFNKCDMGLLINRDNEGNSELTIAKVRYEEIGKRGSVKLLFNSETRRFGYPVTIGEIG